MAVRTKGSVRRSQLITTYGVGSVVAVEDESFMIAGIDQWPVGPPDLHEPRLERELGVVGFVAPPASEDDADIPVVRFPTMMSCPSCKRLAAHRHFTGFGGTTCNSCEVALVPSRFVVVCERGHIDDFPYFHWLHVGSRPSGSAHDMKIETTGATASLRDIVISCSCGVEPVTMEGAFSRTALRNIISCTGRRPWLRDENEECDEIPRTLQRGASNVWFPVVHSAISIPPWSEGALKLLNRHWTLLRHVPEDALLPTIRGANITVGTEYSPDDLVLAVQQRREREAEPLPTSGEALKRQEYEALVRGRAETSREQEFVCVPPEEIGGLAREWFAQVMLVKRLREVRALKEFTRLLPPSPADPPERRAPLSSHGEDWLPAIDVTGEGVFLRLDEDLLRGWESRPVVVERARRIDANYAKSFAEREKDPDRTITPRLLLLHTLAHALINQWSLECGYPASALRERLYASEEMAGILVYTATSDSAGSLGGVISLAEGDRLDAALGEAVARSAWCSSDPLCIEAEAAGVDSLNLAACHACVLLPEVSCEERNLVLDRALLVGLPDNADVGFFSPLLER